MTEDCAASVIADIFVNTKFHLAVQVNLTNKDYLYRVRQNEISQHKNCYISEMPEYFCTKFRSFVWHNTVH